jgi:3-deoxy-manno-octulosonate cytidylyltransferase (CMP-KDO synthetase)
LYFSRSVIPFAANTALKRHFAHRSIWFRKAFAIYAMAGRPAGAGRKLEQLRYLENGVPIRMALVDFKSVAIDTPEDLEMAEKFL